MSDHDEPAEHSPSVPGSDRGARSIRVALVATNAVAAAAALIQLDGLAECLSAGAQLLELLYLGRRRAARKPR